MSSFPPNNNFTASCPRCGKQLAPNETQCTRCGLSIPANLFNGPHPGLNNQAGGRQAPQGQFGQPLTGGAPWSGQQGWGQAAPPSFPQQRSGFSDGANAPQTGQGGFLPPFPSSLNQPQNNFQAPPQEGAAQPNTFQSGGFQGGGSQSGGFQGGNSPSVNPQSGGFSGNNIQGGAFPGSVPQGGDFQSGGFQGGGYQNGGYQNDGYQNGGYQSGALPDNNGFQNGFQNGSFPNNNGFRPATGNFQNPRANVDVGQDFQVATPKRKNNPARILLVVVLLLVVLVGSSLGAYFVLGHTGGNGTGTTTNNGVSLPAPTTAPIFKDDFVNNNSGWDLTSNPGNFTVKVSGGSMVLEDDNHLLYPALLPSEKTKNLHNFRMSVDAFLSQGDPKNGYGMIFRCTLDQNGDLANYYGFEVYGDGTYIIFKHAVDAKGNATRTQIGGDLENPNGLIQKSNHLNHLTVIAKNDTLQFFVNNQLLTSVKDTSFQSGLASLFVSNIQNIKGGAKATFSHLAVYDVK